MYDLEELSVKDKLVRRLLNEVTVVLNVTLALVTLAPLCLTCPRNPACLECYHSLRVLHNFHGSTLS